MQTSVRGDGSGAAGEGEAARWPGRMDGRGSASSSSGGRRGAGTAVRRHFFQPAAADELAARTGAVSCDRRGTKPHDGQGRDPASQSF